MFESWPILKIKSEAYWIKTWPGCLKNNIDQLHLQHKFYIYCILHGNAIIVLSSWSGKISGCRISESDSVGRVSFSDKKLWGREGVVT